MSEEQAEREEEDEEKTEGSKGTFNWMEETATAAAGC